MIIKSERDGGIFMAIAEEERAEDEEDKCHNLRLLKEYGR